MSSDSPMPDSPHPAMWPDFTAANALPPLSDLLAMAQHEMGTWHLHSYARKLAAELPGISMKLVRWNDVVDVARDFYPRDVEGGIRECLQSCVPGDPQYDGKTTLAISLRENYKWML